MTTTAHGTPAASSAIVQSRSLKARVIIFTLVFFLVGIWSLGFYAGRLLRQDMQHLLSEQQFSTASFIAQNVNDEFVLRVTALQKIAERITPSMISNPRTLQTMLEGQPVFYSLFNNGVAAAGIDGTVIAEFTRLPGRLGANFIERDYIIGPLKEGKVTIGRPVMSKLMHAPAFVIAVPIRDKQGKVIGVIAGVTDLRLPNFLDKVTNNLYGKTGAYLLIAPQHNLIVTGTDKSRIMQPLPARGLNPLFDRYAQGFEGSGIVVDSRGLEVLSSAKQIPAAGWLLVVRITTEEAFAPIRAMQNRMLIATIFLTLLAGGLIWWILRRQLAPVFTTIKILTDLSNTDQPLQPLPIRRQDEIGVLIGSFNHLLENLGQREGELKESDDKHKRMIANISDVIAIMDKDGILKYKSPNIEKWFGWQPEDLVGTDAWLTVHPDDLERIQKEFFTLLDKDNSVATAEYRYKCKDGSYKSIALTAVNLTNDPIIGGVLMNYRDITERKKAEETLMESSSRLTRAEKTAKMGNWKLMLNTKEFIGSPGARIIYGVEGDILSFDDARKCTLPEYTDILNKGLTDLITKNIPYSLDIKICRPIDGKIMDIHSIAEYDKENNIVYGVIQDITDSKQMEDELTQREAKYRLLADNMKDQIWLMNLDFQPTYISPSVEKSRGYSFEEIVQLPLNKHLTESSLHAATEFFSVEIPKALADPTYYLRRLLELEFYRKDGSTLWVESTFTLIRDENGKPESILGVGRDVTERKQAQEEKSKLEAQLQQSQKMEAIGTLAGGIAHDFNNILAIICGYTEIAMDEDSKEIRQQDLQETLKGAERAKNLVKQILTFSRQDDHEKKPLDIKVLLKEAIKFLRASIPTTVEIDQHLTEESCYILADPTQMHQVIINLCTNASHAMKETRGTLKIELANAELAKDEIPNYPDLQLGHYVKLTVSDTGQGIDPSIVKRIFDPFFTTKSVDEGTGLGLSVVYGIVKSHGGVINVYSEQGKGAAFHVYLPRITYGEDMKVDRRKPETGGTERILFVDDEPALVDLGTRMLTSLGYEVTSVLSSVEALDKFQAKPESCDLVITDMTLPKMTGIDLSRKLLKIRPDIPIILCSGNKDPDTEAQAKSLGIKAYLTKPLTKRELSGVVRDVLDGHGNSIHYKR